MRNIEDFWIHAICLRWFCSLSSTRFLCAKSCVCSSWNCSFKTLFILKYFFCEDCEEVFRETHNHMHLLRSCLAVWLSCSCSCFKLCEFVSWKVSTSFRKLCFDVLLFKWKNNMLWIFAKAFIRRIMIDFNVLFMMFSKAINL